jgi:hypothetical protein
MRRHYESLNYFDTQAGTERFRFSRTQGQDEGVLTAPRDVYCLDADEGPVPFDFVLTEDEVYALRDMLNEVVEDWN